MAIVRLTFAVNLTVLSSPFFCDLFLPIFDILLGTISTALNLLFTIWFNIFDFRFYFGNMRACARPHAFLLCVCEMSNFMKNLHACCCCGGGGGGGDRCYWVAICPLCFSNFGSNHLNSFCLNNTIQNVDVSPMFGFPFVFIEKRITPKCWWRSIFKMILILLDGPLSILMHGIV